MYGKSFNLYHVDQIEKVYCLPVSKASIVTELNEEIIFDTTKDGIDDLSWLPNYNMDLVQRRFHNSAINYDEYIEAMQQLRRESRFNFKKAKDLCIIE